MSHVDDYAPRSRRDNRSSRPAPPYPYPSDGMNANDEYGSDRGGRPHRGDENVPPAPPIGEGLKPAMRRDGSRTRLPPDARPQFPDEASNAPDLERKNRARDRQFRDMRDGYESEEGEAHKKNMAPPPRRYTDDDRPRGQEPRSRRPHDRDPPYPPPWDAGRRRGDYDDEEPPRSSRKKRDPYYDDDARPPRRRGDRPPPDIEYGSDPIPARRGSERRPRRRDDYSDEEEEDDYRPRRRRSAEDSRRAPRRGDELDYNSDGRRRRDVPYDDRDRDRRRRDNRSRRRYDDDDEYDDYDRNGRDKDRRRGEKPNKPVMVGKYDVGPWIEKGQKHYATLAPIVTPLVINMARKYMTGQSGSGGGGSGRH